MNSNMQYAHDRPSRLSSDYNRSTKRFTQMNLKSEILNVTTPLCYFQYCWIASSKPDTKFDPMGEWRITCLINPEEKDQQGNNVTDEFIGQLTGLLDRWKGQLKTAQPSKTFKLAALPWGFEEVKYMGEVKPYFKVKAKMKVGGARPDGTQWKNRPPTLFNADGSVMSDTQKVVVEQCGEGTTGQVNLRCSGWETPAFGVGIKIQPEAVMIKNHVEYSRSATGYGFQTEEPQEPTQECPMPASTVAANEF